jgi:hypothetical protein
VGSPDLAVIAKQPALRAGSGPQIAPAIQGVQKDLSPTSTLSLGGTTFTPASLVAFIRRRIDASNRVLAARAAWLDASKQYEAIDRETSAVLRDLRQVVIGKFGASSPALADFGFTPKEKK